jgi:hypothetical protein
MLQFLSRLFGVRTARDASDGFDPLYGLSKRALQDWLLFNPQLRKGYESALRTRALRAREGQSREGAQPQRLVSDSRADNDRIDVSSEDSFPASDAPSWTGVRGTGPPSHSGSEGS